MEKCGLLQSISALPPEKEPPDSNGIGGWVGPRSVLNSVVKRKKPCPCREPNLRYPAR